MRGALRSSPCLPSLWLLQRAAGGDRSSYSIITPGSAEWIAFSLRFSFPAHAMRIAVDAMGGDHGCDVVVEGVKLALHQDGRVTKVFLVGQQEVIETSLRSQSLKDPRVEILHTNEVLTMQDKPLAAVRGKKRCSLTQAVDLVKSGQADAAISPGNTGGLVAAATLKLGTLPGVERA